MSQFKVLVADDNELERNILLKALARKGNLATIEAHSGEQCLEILDQEQVDLILMDIVMPGIHGTEALKKIRERFNPIQLPVIMITAKSEVADIVSCLQNGANDYITKPVNFEIALSRISTHLRLAQVSKEMGKLKEIAALDALITTYNHEINNPLAIAIGCLNGPLLKDEKTVEKLKTALWRVADIVKQIRAVTDKKETEYEDYAKSGNMVKVR